MAARMSSNDDVPSPIDFRDAAEASDWARKAQARPGRAEIFSAFVRELNGLRAGHATVLELGSGPGFLAERLLQALPELRLVLLDFSPAMHDLARSRLGALCASVTFVTRSFREPDWADGLGPFDAVVTNQAVHELRHKRHAAGLHYQVRGILKRGSPYLVADHFCGEGGMSNTQLYMSSDEQRQALASAGFADVARVAGRGSLVMHRAREGQ